MGKLHFIRKESLEIKEICNAGPEPNDEPDDESSVCDSEKTTENLEEETVKSEQMEMKAPQERKRRVDSVNAKYECDQCHKTYSGGSELSRHKQSAHQGVKYDCDQCDYQARRQDNLALHIQSIHEGIKYACGQCDLQFTQKSNLRTHIKKKHDICSNTLKPSIEMA